MSILDKAPALFVLSMTVPEAVMLLCFIYMIWLTTVFNIHQLPDKSGFEERVSLGVTIIAGLFISALTIIITGFVMGMISASFIAKSMTWAELISVLAVVLLFLYFKCKFKSEVVPSKSVRVVDITMVVWIISRVF